MPRYSTVYRRDRWDTETGRSYELSAESAARILLDGGRVDVTAVYAERYRENWAGDPATGLMVTIRLEEADEHGHREPDVIWSGAALTPSGSAEMLAMAGVLEAAQLLADMANARELITARDPADWEPMSQRLVLALGAAQARAAKRAQQLRARLFELTGAS